MKNLLFGAIAVATVILVMMGWRSALIVSSALPLSALMVLSGLRFMDIPIHQMSITGLIVALGLAHAISLDFLMDDAFISFRYAQHLVEGHGLVFNPGERVEGMTKLYGASLLISEGTFERLEDPGRHHIREIDRVQAKGKRIPAARAASRRSEMVASTSPAVLACRTMRALDQPAPWHGGGPQPRSAVAYRSPLNNFGWVGIQQLLFLGDANGFRLGAGYCGKGQPAKVDAGGPWLHRRQ